MNSGTITKRTVKATDSLFDSLQHMYSKKDLENALCRVWGNMEKVYRYRDRLYELMDRSGVKFSKGESPEKYIALCRERLTPMNRSTEKLLDEAESAFKCLSCPVPENKKAEYGAFHMMLKTVGIAHEEGKETGYYYGLVENSGLKEGREYYNTILEALYQNYSSYPSPEDFMRRIVDNLAHEDNMNSEEPVRMRILRQFILEGGYLKGWYGGKAALEEYVKGLTGAKKLSSAQVNAAIDDSIFSAMEKMMADELSEKEKALGKKADKYQKRTIEDKYELFKICGDLASGRFKAQGGTKKALYLFAMAFNMTYYSGEPDEIFDPVSDMEKNLFADYYTNSFFRFLNEEYRDPDKKAGLDLEFTGEGINYKNFAEMVFIYCIAQDCPACEKIQKAKKLIGLIKGSGTDAHKDGGTAFYRKMFTGDIIKMSEDEFVRFVRENYDCGKKSDSPFTLCSAKNTAYENYCRIMSGLKSSLGCGVSAEECSSKLSEISELADKFISNAAASVSKFFTALSDAAASDSSFESDEETKRCIAMIKDIKQTLLKGCIKEFLEESKNALMDCIGKEISEHFAAGKGDTSELEGSVCKKFESFVGIIQEGVINLVSENVGELEKNKCGSKVTHMCHSNSPAMHIKENLYAAEKYVGQIKEAVSCSVANFGVDSGDSSGLSLDLCNTGLYFLDPAPESVARLKKLRSEKSWEEYIDLLCAVNEFIGYTKEESISEKNSERRRDPRSYLITALDCDRNRVSRVYMVTAFYYQYIMSRETEEGDTYMKSESFEMLFDEMKEELDIYLRNSFYPEFSGKNFFDVCIALSAYSYLTQ